LHLLLWLVFRQPHPDFINVRTAYASKIWAQLIKKSSPKIKHKKIPRVHLVKYNEFIIQYLSEFDKKNSDLPTVSAELLRK
jgi:hypothetical protein